MPRKRPVSPKPPGADKLIIEAKAQPVNKMGREFLRSLAWGGNSCGRGLALFLPAGFTKMICGCGIWLMNRPTVGKERARGAGTRLSPGGYCREVRRSSSW